MKQRSEIESDVVDTIMTSHMTAEQKQVQLLGYAVALLLDIRDNTAKKKL